MIWFLGGLFVGGVGCAAFAVWVINKGLNH